MESKTKILVAPVLAMKSYLGRQTPLVKATRMSAIIVLAVLQVITALTCLFSGSIDAGETKLASGIITIIVLAMLFYIASYSVRECLYRRVIEPEDILIIMIVIMGVFAFYVLIMGPALLASVIGSIAAIILVAFLALAMESSGRSAEVRQKLITAMMVIATGLAGFGILHGLPRLI